MPKRPSTASSRLESDVLHFHSRKDFAIRYPSPDPQDPFAPLWVLRSRQAGSSSQISSVDDEHSFCDSSYPGTPVKEQQTVECKPKRPWHRIKYRRSQDQKLAQAPDPQLTIRRPKSLPPRRFPSRRPSESVRAADISSPSLNAYNDLQSYLRANGGHPLLDMDLDKSPTRGSSCDSAPGSRPSSRLDQVPVTDSSRSSKKGFALARLIRLKKSSVALPPPPTPSVASSSPFQPSTPVDSEATPPVDSRSLFKPRRPSYSGSVASTTMSAIELVDLPARKSLSRQLDVSYHPSLTDVQRNPSCQTTASVDPRGSLCRRNARLRKLPPRPHTSPGRPERREQNNPLPTPLPCNQTACELSAGAHFDQSALPTQSQLAAAAALTVIAENGTRVRFGDLWERQRTVVCFIRHFWCPFCQDYMDSIAQHAKPAVLKKANLSLIIISNGSYGMIKSYRQIFRTPFPVYTDPTHRLYTALGMTLHTLDPGTEDNRGKYIKHGVMSGIAKVVLNALKVGMPVWEKGGDIAQLGGEFVLGPGLKCAYAHRMRTTRGHSPITKVLVAGGADVFARIQRDSVTVGQRSIYMMSQDQETKWLESRKRSWTRLQSLKEQRRLGNVPADDRTQIIMSQGENNAISEEDEGEVALERTIHHSRIWEAAMEHHATARHTARR